MTTFEIYIEVRNVWHFFLFGWLQITHQYRLTNEHGPAHKKSFTVTLTLGTEEYTADAPSIKKAQHSAAAEALAKTSFAHPTPKVHKSLNSAKCQLIDEQFCIFYRLIIIITYLWSFPFAANITPTVELNALAMKRGESAIYKLLDPSQNQNVYQQNSPFLVRRPYFGVSLKICIFACLFFFFTLRHRDTLSMITNIWKLLLLTFYKLHANCNM